MVRDHNLRKNCYAYKYPESPVGSPVSSLWIFNDNDEDDDDLHSTDKIKSSVQSCGKANS